jgi:hypothetical protein
MKKKNMLEAFFWNRNSLRTAKVPKPSITARRKTGRRWGRPEGATHHQYKLLGLIAALLFPMGLYLWEDSVDHRLDVSISIHRWGVVLHGTSRTIVRTDFSLDLLNEGMDSHGSASLSLD